MSRTRNKKATVRLTEDEYHALCKRVEQSGLYQQEYIRRSILGQEIMNIEPLKVIMPEMKRQGVNLNQIAKRLNERGYVDYKNELGTALKEVQETWQSLKQFLLEHR